MSTKFKNRLGEVAIDVRSLRSSSPHKISPSDVSSSSWCSVKVHGKRETCAPLKAGCTAIMLHPRLLLLVIIGGVGILLLFEMGFENRLLTGGFAPSVGPLKAEVVSTAVFNPDRKQLPSEAPGCGNRSLQQTLPNGTLDKSTLQRCSGASNYTTVPARSDRVTSVSVSIFKRTAEREKMKPFDNPAKDFRDRLLHVNKQHGVTIHRERLDKLLHPILGMPIIKSESVLRVLVVTYFRAGSTFLGDILQQNWKTFYHFEPLHIMSRGLRIDESQTHQALNLLNHLFRCNFSSSASYVRWASKAKNQFLFRHNHFLWATCRLKITTCFMPEYISQVCKRARLQVMKVTRVHMNHVEQFLRNNPTLKVKVVHLVRDPRGIMNSRKVLDWCNETSCMDSKELCKEMQNDLAIYQKMRQEHPKSFVQVRYEDLALNSSAEVRALYKALGLPFTSVVQRYIQSHTHANANEINNPYSTRRNSSVAAFEWKHKLTFKTVEAIQNECSEVMDDLGYKTYKSEEEQMDVNFPLLRRNSPK